jgi:hypothetical protein
MACRRRSHPLGSPGICARLFTVNPYSRKTSIESKTCVPNSRIRSRTRCPTIMIGTNHRRVVCPAGLSRLHAKTEPYDAAELPGGVATAHDAHHPAANLIFDHRSPGNETEAVLAAFREGAVIRVIALGIEHAAGAAVSGHAIPAQIGQMGTERRSPCPVPHDACLDGDVARPIRHELGSGHAGRSPAAESGTTAAPGSAVNSSCLPGGDQGLSDERFGATNIASPPIPDATRPGTKIVVADHDADARDVRVVVNCQGVVQIGGL